ncbi:pheromone B alpha 1 receptor [Crepidotus variabilis]|uniref:Pheromone B alpha 1 receptor n=1 Tax=Crepidotus variabilis TaxID=179855 RepID=A0A9P6JIN3_9AGAR|nr:pheromone B alpha 1 receptor [Crepidotus variabilis]
MTYPADATNAAFTACAFVGFLMCSIPLPWHLEAWNTGTCLYMIWTGLSCLNAFINSIIWHKNAINWAPVWCDISSKFIVGSAVAIPAASLCINRRLFHIASVKTVRINKADKRRDVIIDLCIGLGLPILAMILHYIPQGHRFDIFEDQGCWPTTYNTPVALVLVYLPPILIGLCSGYYAIRSIIAFNHSRAQFNELLSSYSNLTSNRYFRLMCLAGIEALCTVPFGIYALYLNAAGGMHKWKGFADTHWGFHRVDQYPAIMWRANREMENAHELSRWFIFICAVIFFAFFGFADEAKKNYRSAIQTVSQHLGISTFSSTSSGDATTSGSFTKSKTTSGSGKIRPALPVFVHKEMLRRQDSIDSFTNMSLSINDASGFLNEKKEDEKDSKFSPTSTYGGITLNDVGGTLADFSDSPISPISSSSASSISIPSPALTREHSMLSISSVRRESFVPSSPISPVESTVQKAHTHDVV